MPKIIILTPEQETFIRLNYRLMNATEMGKLLHLHHSKVSHSMRVMGLRSQFGNHHKSAPIPKDLGTGYWNDQLHAKYFNY